MFGEMQRIIGAPLPQIKSLELSGLIAEEVESHEEKGEISS